MKSAADLNPSDPYQRLLQEYDLREIDSNDARSLFHRKYMARLRWVVGTVQRQLAPGSIVLEVGCSQANASLLLAERGYRAVGLDIRPKALGYALSKHTDGPFFVVAGSAAHLPVSNQQVDGIILGELLEHCADPVGIVRECSKALAPGGIAVLTTPNGQYIGSTEPLYRPDSQGNASLAQQQFGAAGDDHLFAFTLPSLKQVLAAAGLQPGACGYVGSAIYSDRLSPLKRLLPLRWLGGLSTWISSTPGLNRWLSYSLVAVARKPVSGDE